MLDKNGEVIHSVSLVKLKMVREEKIGYNTVITDPEDTVKLIRKLFKDSYREMMVVIGIDNTNHPTVIHTVGLGSPNMTTVSVSSIFKPVLLSNAVNMILVHNHPCSTMSPSQADINLTKKVEKIADQLEITLFDHIIVNVDCSEFYSFKTQGLL